MPPRELRQFRSSGVIPSSKFRPEALNISGMRRTHAHQGGLRLGDDDPNDQNDQIGRHRDAAILAQQNPAARTAWRSTQRHDKILGMKHNHSMVRKEMASKKKEHASHRSAVARTRKKIETAKAKQAGLKTEAARARHQAGIDAMQAELRTYLEADRAWAESIARDVKHVKMLERAIDKEDSHGVRNKARAKKR